MFKIKSTSKNKQAKNIFYLKSKLNQVSVLALLNWQMLCHVSENAILHAIIYWCYENYSIFNKLIHVDLKPKLLITSFLAPLSNN